MGIQPKQVSRALLERVFYPMTAILALDAQGEIIDLYLFDTEFAQEDIRVSEGAAEIWMMTNHPGGYRHLDELDWRTVRRVLKCVPGIPLRVFIAGEDIGCVEVEMELP